MVRKTRPPLFACMIALAALGWACSSRPSGSVTGSGASSASGTSSASGAPATSSGAGSSSGAGGSSASGGPISFDGGLPPACPASAAGDTPAGQDTTSPGSVTSFTYTNVGSAGAYDKVVDGWSQATGCVADPSGMLCDTTYRMPVQVSGPITPFDEDLSMVFAGPIELYQIAVYAPSGGNWLEVAYWDRCTTEGLAFAGNKSWYQCGGFVQSYVDADGTAESAAPVQFGGSIAAGTQVNVMSDATCTGAACGWSSGLPLAGFSGDAAGSKIFVTKMRMPISTSTPAYWILPGQVMRSSQYGCNCREEGCDATYKGGCGELDVVEVTGGVATTLVASTSIYSYQSCFGGVGQWDRPVNETATFVVIFDAPSKQIGIRRLGATDFDFAATLPATTVSAWLAEQGGTRAMP
jgi:hypothetical protein